MMNPGVGVIMPMPHWSTLKYPNYKKDANPNARVRVFNVAIRVNGETSEYIINGFSYTLKKNDIKLVPLLLVRIS